MIGCLLAVLALDAPTAQAGRANIVGATASSAYPGEEGVSYGAAMAIDGRSGTSWVEGDAGSGLGAWIELDLGGEVEVQAVRLWAGMWYSETFWTRANRPKELEIVLSDGTRETCLLEDSKTVQDCVLGGKRTSTLRLLLKQVHAGTTWLDTGLSEIQVLTPTPGEAVEATAIEATSVLAPDEDGSYAPEQVADGVIDTMWCEGSADGDGAGESLTFTFATERTVSRLQVLNGVGGSLPVWMKANRAKTATLHFSDGSTQPIALKNSFRVETVSFEPTRTSSVRLTFGDVSRGKEYNDLCVSEAYFLQ